MRIRSNKNRIGIVKVEGVITDGASVGTDRAKVIAALKEAERRGTKGIVLRVNSPGGTVAACQEIYMAVGRMLEKGIPVVASMGDMAASGGVYISMAASEVVANPGTITGSIGVIIRGNDLSSIYQRFGVSPKVVKSGDHKDMLASYRSFSPEELSLLQGVIDDSYQQFVEAVATGRKKSPDEIRKIADGRIFTGRQASQYGLVDHLGDLDLAVERAGALAGIKGKPKTLTIEPHKGWIAKLFSPIFGGLLNFLAARIAAPILMGAAHGYEGSVPAGLAGYVSDGSRDEFSIPMWILPRF